MKRQEESLQLEFLIAERQPVKRKSSNQVLGQSVSEPKRRSNLRNQECQNIVCKRIKKDNENLLNENIALKQMIQQNQKEISDLKEELNTSNVWGNHSIWRSNDDSWLDNVGFIEYTS